MDVCFFFLLTLIQKLKLTNEAKRDAIYEFMEYVFFTYKRPKIAVAYFDDTTLIQIKQIMEKKKVLLWWW